MALEREIAMEKQQGLVETGKDYQPEADQKSLAAQDCYLSNWYAYNLQVGGGMATVLDWGQQSMEESGVTDIARSGAFVTGNGANGQRVRALSQNLNCTPPGGGVGIPCFAVLSVADTNVDQTNNLLDTISQKWKAKLGIP